MKWFNFFKTRSVAVFITDSETCPCWYLYSIAKTAQEIDAVHLTDIFSEESLKKLKSINQNKKLLIFLHGHIYPLNCFFIRKEEGKNRVVNIPNEWWKKIINRKQLIYFHVCYGSNIIKKDSVFNGIFDSWVSYSGNVDNVQTTFDKIRAIQKIFLVDLAEAMSKRKSSSGMKASVEAAYKNIEAKLYDNDEYIPGHSAMIRMVGNNLDVLEKSIN